MTGNRPAASAQLGYRHQKVQRLRRLLRRRALREAEGAFVAEGAKLLAEALDAGADVEAVFVEAGTVDPVVARASAAGIRVYHLERGVMARVADTVTPQPVASVVAMRRAGTEVLRDARSVVVLVDVRDPGNAGTVLRSAEASGVGAVVVCEGSVDVHNPKTVRSSAGSLFHVPTVTGLAAAAVLDALRAEGFRLLGTTMEGGSVYDTVDLTRRIALVFGNEANGLDGSTAAALDEMVSIPIAGRTESLNVSMAASVLCFEVARQVRAR